MSSQQLTTYINSKTRIRRFNTLASAISFLKGTKYQNVTPIILGDDNKFWVANSPKRAYQLITAGYSQA